MMCMILKKYFEYIGNKTYINTYPKEIIDISKLNNVLVELGGGKGNDMHFMLTQLKLNPNNLFFIEKDPEIFLMVEKKLSGLIDKSHLLLKDALNSKLPNNFANYVYVNNFLHCLESKENIAKQFQEVKRILKKGGVFFGRTLSNKIDEKLLSNFLNSKNLTANQKFFLETALAIENGELLGLSEKEFRNFANTSGFKNAEIQFVTNQKDRPTKDFYFRVLK